MICTLSGSLFPSLFKPSSIGLLAVQFVQVSLCNRAEGQSWQDLNAPLCVAVGSALTPPASGNQWGQLATLALCGADGRRMSLPPPEEHSSTYKWVASHRWSCNMKSELC